MRASNALPLAEGGGAFELYLFDGIALTADAAWERDFTIDLDAYSATEVRPLGVGRRAGGQGDGRR